MSSDIYFNVTQAAKQTNLSVVTIRSYLAKNTFPNATMTLKGKAKLWAIPLTDLSAAGLLTKPATIAEEQTLVDQLAATKDKLNSIENQLSVTQELLAEVRGERDHLRSLIAPKKVRQQLETRDTQEQRRRWFGRNR
jgi:negative regulator of replication initiation